MAQSDNQPVLPSIVLAVALLLMTTFLFINPAAFAVRLAVAVVGLAAAFWAWSQFRAAVEQAQQQSVAQQDIKRELQEQQQDKLGQQQQFLQAVLSVWRDQQQMAAQQLETAVNALVSQFHGIHDQLQQSIPICHRRAHWPRGCRAAK